MGLRRRTAAWLLGEQPGESRGRLAELVLGEEPLSVVDVGALWGLQPELQPIAAWVDAVGFDPDPEECAALNERARSAGLSQRFLPYAVAGRDGPRPFHVLRKAASSSLLEPNLEYHRRFPDAERMDVVRTIEVETRALGRVLQEAGAAPEFLKLDVHGVEGEILASLEPAQWDRLLGVHVELLLAEHYLGQTSLAEIHGALVRHGLELYALKRYSSRRSGFDTSRHSSRGQLAFGDALYLRKSEGLDPARLRRLAVVAAVFEHNDFALELFRQSADEQAASLVEELSRRPGPLRRALSARLVRICHIGRRLHGAPHGAWTSDQPPDWL